MSIHSFITLLAFLLISPILKAQIGFASPLNRIVGSDIESLTIGDVNNDGLNDAVVATTFYFDEENDYCIFVFLQQADGTMGTPAKYKYTESYGSKTVVQVADLNNDLLNDVVFTFNDSLGIMYQTSSGTLGPAERYYSGNDADGMETGDLNNDGLTDVAVCHWNDDFIKVFYQQPSGGFHIQAFPVESHGWDQLDVNDMNGDGLDDIIYMPGQSSITSLFIFYQDSLTGISSTPAEYTYQHGSYATWNGMGTGDLNNDGRIDIVGSMGGNSGSSFIGIIYQNENGTLGGATYLPSYDIPTPVRITDLNCDGKSEIIVGHYAWGKFSVWEQDNLGNFSGYKLYPSLYYAGPYGLDAGDLNNDSRNDVLSTSGGVTVHFMLNTSAPEGTLSSDTLVVYTTNVIDTTSHWTNVTQVSDTERVNQCLIETTYELTTTSGYIYTDQVGDSLFPRTYSICGVSHQDTIIHHFDHSDNYYYSYADSVVIAIDTIIENQVQIHSWVRHDTIGLTPMPFSDIIVHHSYKMLNDSIYITIDSLMVTGMALKIDLINSYYTVIQGIRCGSMTIDTNIYQNPHSMIGVIQSDTTFISTTVTGYPAGSGEPGSLSQMKIYPNPASSSFYLDFDNLYDDPGPFEIRLMNNSGQIMKKFVTPAESKVHFLIGRDGLPPGSYIVQVKGRKSIGSRYVIFE